MGDGSLEVGAGGTHYPSGDRANMASGGKEGSPAGVVGNMAHVDMRVGGEYNRTAAEDRAVVRGEIV